MTDKQYKEKVKEIGNNLSETMANDAITIKKLIELEQYEKAAEVKKLSIENLILYTEMILVEKSEQERYAKLLISIFTQMIESKI